MAALLAHLPQTAAWRLLLTLHQRKPANLTATQALNAVRGAEPLDIVVLSGYGWLAGTRAGELVDLNDDDQTNQGLRDLTLLVTAAGTRWCQTSPHNLIMFGIKARDRRTGAPLYNVVREAGAGTDLTHVAKLAAEGYVRVVDARGETIDPANLTGSTKPGDPRRVGLTARGCSITDL